MVDVKNILNETGSIYHGHFLLESGMHSDTYVECAKTLQYTWRTKEMGNEMALRLQRFAPDCILSLTPNGMIIGYEVARTMDVPFMYLEEDKNGNLLFTHCLEPAMFKNILIVQDFIYDEKLVHKAILTLKERASEPIGLSSMIKMGQIEKIDGLVVNSIVDISAKVYEPDACPMCKEGIEIVDVKNLCHDK
ncbi:MAG: hypothetical protein M1542_06725 [Thermotogae bacterium]|jgi:orotate phosphoribosyltransferase|nr:hypothetical protein [Thermotogota bacterium]MCL5032916.1 hypothetical protein [Thermotogota bacterium]